MSKQFKFINTMSQQLTDTERKFIQAAIDLAKERNSAQTIGAIANYAQYYSSKYLEEDLKTLEKEIKQTH